MNRDVQQLDVDDDEVEVELEQPVLMVDENDEIDLLKYVIFLIDVADLLVLPDDSVVILVIDIVYIALHQIELFV